jgi:hypothetical protein
MTATPHNTRGEKDASNIADVNWDGDYKTVQ